MTTENPEKKSEGFIPEHLERILVGTQFLAHKHLPGRNSVVIGDSLENIVSSELLRVVINHVSDTTFSGAITMQLSFNNTYNPPLSFTSDFFGDLLKKLGYGHMMDETGKENLGALMGEIAESIGLSSETSLELKISYVFNPNLLTISIGNPLDAGDRHSAYTFYNLCSKDFKPQRNIVYASMTRPLDGKIHPGYRAVSYDDGITRREEILDDSRRIKSFAGYLRESMQKSEAAYGCSDYLEANRHLLRFAGAYQKVMENNPLLLSSERKEIFDRIMCHVDELVAIYATMESLELTVETICHGVGRPLTQDEIDNLVRANRGEFDDEKRRSIEYGRELTPAEQEKNNSMLYDANVATHIREIYHHLDVLQETIHTEHPLPVQKTLGLSLGGQ